MKNLAVIVFFLVATSACATAPSSPAPRVPAASPERQPEDVVLKEGESILCKHWLSPYRTNEFELKFENKSKTYRLAVNTMADSDSKKMSHLKTYQNMPLWCVFKENKTFACTTQNLRDERVAYDPKAPAFFFRRFAQTSLIRGLRANFQVDAEDYLDLQFSDASAAELDQAVPEASRYFPLSACKYKSGGGLF